MQIGLANNLPPLPKKNYPRLWAEIGIVLALGLGQSAIYAIVRLADRLTRDVPLAAQSATLNPSRNDREIFDLLAQLLTISFALAPVLLVCYLTYSSTKPRLGLLGLDGKHVTRDVAWGASLLLVVGIPGIGIYLLGRSLGLFVALNPVGLGNYWWTVPVLLLAAARAAIEEEVVILGYLFARLSQLGWSLGSIILATSVLRASYHLYQGPGAFAGNLLMGLLFGFLFARKGRLVPFLVAHFLLDAVAFVGYPWAAENWPALFGLPT